jgi:hypothetical protein
MARPSNDRITAALLNRHGQTYAEELKIDLGRGTPSALFRWLCASILLSAPIGAKTAMAATKALAEQGWTTADKMAAATWEQRTRTLNRSGYARYDESTSLRVAAERTPERERALLKECKGIGEVGADIFCREAQIVWDEFYPFADRRALAAARRLGLEDDPGKLAKRVSRKDFPRLVAALVRTGLAKDFDGVLEEAAKR